MKQNVNSVKAGGAGYRRTGTILPVLFICLFALLACVNTNPQITETLLEQQFAQIFAANTGADHTMKESFVADLTTDGVAEGLVTYVVTPRYDNGGGNWWTQGAAIFYTEQGELYYFEVVFPNIGSGDGSGSYTVTGISDGIIQVAALSYADDDPHCCPSIETKHKFKLEGKGLVEVR